jgi:hypothetical protein
VKINLAGVQSPVTEASPVINTNFIRGQFNAGSRNLAQQLLSNNVLQSQSQPTSLPTFTIQQQQQQTFAPSSGGIVTFPSQQSSSSSSSLGGNQALHLPFTSTYTGFGSSPANVEIIDESQLPTIRFKRQAATDEKQVNKRDLVTLTDGSIIDDKFFDTEWYDGLAQFGGSDFKNSLTKHDNLEAEIREHDREPAEGEVEAVRSYCNSCLVEPFESALAIAWKSARSGHKVLRARASKICGDF